MQKLLRGACLAALLSCPAYAAPQQAITYSVAVCDPYNPQNCLQPSGGDLLTGISPVVTQSGTSAVGKASPGNLYSAYAVNSAATAAYLACIDASSVPAPGASISPKDVAYLGNTIGATAQINYASGPPNIYTAGITCIVTTSLTTYTAGPSDFISVRAR